MNLVSRGRFSCWNEKLVQIGFDCISTLTHRNCYEVINRIISCHFKDSYKNLDASC